MILILMLLNILSANDIINIYRHPDTLRIDNITHNNEGVIMGNTYVLIPNSFSNLKYNLISFDNGRTFDTVSSFIGVSTPNKPLGLTHYALSFKESFIFVNQENGLHLLKTSDYGKSFDTITISDDRKLSTPTFALSQNDTNLLIYSISNNMVINGKAYFYLLFSTDGFETYKEIDFELMKEEVYAIKDLKLINDEIELFCYYYSEVEDFYEYRKVSYNLITEKYSIQLMKDILSDFKIIDKVDDYYFSYLRTIYEKKDNYNDIYSTLIVKFNDENFEVLDTVNPQYTGRMSLISYKKDNYIFTLKQNGLHTYNIETKESFNFEFEFNLLGKNYCIFSPEKGYSWWDDETNTLLFSIGTFCVLEFDVFSILSVENKNSNTLIFPNPAPKGQTIILELEEYANNVVIYDLLGNEIMKLNQFSNKYEIPTANISPGVYIAIIESAGKRKITKFIVE